MMDTLKTYIDKGMTWFYELSQREKFFVILAASILIFMGIYTVAEDIVTKFDDQAKKLAAVEESIKDISPLIAGYEKLRNQQVAIEERFKGAKPNFAVRSYLETLLKEKADITSRVSINTGTPDDFGDSLKRTLVKLRFSADEPKQLTNFLKALQNGSHPLLLSEININKLGRRLDVSAEVQSITPRASDDS